MTHNRHACKKALSLLLAQVLALGLFPGAELAASAEEGQEENLTETVSGSQLLTIDDTDPEGFAPSDTTNPYGGAYDPEGTGTGTLMIPWDELAVLNESYMKETHTLKWYEGDRGYEKGKALYADDWHATGSYSMEIQNLAYVQSVAFDKNGTGRKDVIAYVGYDPDGGLAVDGDGKHSRYHLWTIDTSTGISLRTDLAYWVRESSGGAWKEYKPVYNNEDSWQCDHYAANSLLAVTAGDFGRGHQTLVIATTARNRNDNGTSTILFEYELVYAVDEQKWVLQRIGDPVILESFSTDEYLNTVSLAAGDLNGDDVDELIVVLARSKGVQGDAADTRMYVYSGNPNDTSGILTRSRTTTKLFDEYTDKDNDKYYRTYSAPGVAVGDVDGDGEEEIVVGGYHYVKKNNGSFENEKKQVLGIYEQNKEGGGISKVCVSKPDLDDENNPGLKMNRFIEKGYYVGDYIHPRAAVATVAFNGQNGKDLIYFNGEIMTYTPDAGISVTYTPTYFKEGDFGMGGTLTSNTWVSDVAVGNFDHNEIGREQVYYVIALKHSGQEKYGYKVGMIGATYKDREDMLGTITGSSFYSTKIQNEDYMLNDADAKDGTWVACHTVITAIDNNDDGVRLRYRGKNYVYSDPKIEAILQAAPYFDGVQSPGSTVYSFSTGYGTSDDTTTSLDWGVGFTGEGEVSLLVAAKLAIEAGAAFNYTWEFEKGYETNYTSSFETTNQNTVLIQRTPIVFYNYDMYDAKSGTWVENFVQVPMPLGPVWSQLSISNYNKFVDEYNRKVEEIKATVDTSKYTYEPPVLKKIEDTSTSPTENGEFLIDNEGNPENYLHDWNNGNLTDATKLSNNSLDMELSYSGSSKTEEFSDDMYITVGEGFSGGFSINFSCQFGVGLAGVANAMGGFYVSADFMKGTCHYETSSRGFAVSGTVADLDEKDLEDRGLTEEIIHEYQFMWSFGRWYVDLGTGGGGYSDPQSVEELEEPFWDNSHVPVFGYKTSNVSMPPQPPVLSISYTDGVFTLSWETEDEDKADGYYVYQVVDSDYVCLNDTRLDADTLSFMVPRGDLDDSAGNLYRFVVTSAADLPSGKEIQSIWSNEVTYIPSSNGKSAYEIAVEYGFRGTVEEWLQSLIGNDGNGIVSIDKTGSEGLIDTYTITFDNGNTTTFTVRNGENGVGIASIEKTGSEDNIDIYTITLTNGDTYEMRIANGVDGKEGKSAYQLAVERGFKGTLAEWIASLQGNGIGIESIDYTSSDGNLDTYTILYTDGSTQTFTVTNGTDGRDGADGRGIVSYEKVRSEGNIDYYVVTYTDGTTTEFTVRNGTNGLSAYDIAVLNGFEGSPAEWVASLIGKSGEDGLSIQKIEKISTEGNIDTYGIYLSDTTVYTFTVTNGERGEQGETGAQGEQGIGIANFEKTGTDPDGLTDVYQMTLTNGDVYELRITNGADGQDGAAGKSAYEIAVENGFVGTAAEWVASLVGDDGISVQKIEKTGSEGNIDTYTIWYTDSTSYTFTVTNGIDGVGISGIALASSEDDVDTYQITLTDGNEYSFSVRNGRDGKDGVGVASIEKTGTSEDGLTDTYTITLTDGSTYSYEITNGVNGVGVESIEKTATEGNVDTYIIKMTNGDMAAFTVTNGVDGADGKSAYELAVDNGFEGTVLEWLASLKGDGVSLLGIDSEAVDELTTRYTFKYSDGTTYSFEVSDGEKGKDGRGVVSLIKTGSEGLTDTYTITYTDDTESVITVTNGEKGDKGDKGERGSAGRDGSQGAAGKDGANGVSIIDVSRTGSNGVTDIYTISYSDGNSSSFSVVNGHNGTDGQTGVGIRNVQINEEGDQIVTLTDGTNINAGKVKITQVNNNTSNVNLTKTGGVQSYYFDMPYNEFKTLEIGGKTISADKYSVSEYGDGVLVTISNDVIPDSGTIKAVGSNGSATAKVLNSGSKLPMWLIITLIAMAAVMGIEGIQIARLRKKEEEPEEAGE